MHTYAMQALLIFQSESADDARFDGFLTAARELAAKHGVSLADFQSIRLLQSDYRIEPCCRCESLTVDRGDVDQDDLAVLPDFWFNVRRGTSNESGLICDLCNGRDVAV